MRSAVGIAPVISVKWTTAEAVGDCMHLDVKKCKNDHHCGIAQQRALSAMQLEFDEAAWAKRALALQV